MTVKELKDALEDYPEYWEVKLSCPQIQGAILSNDFDLWCDGDDLFLELELDKEVYFMITKDVLTEPEEHLFDKIFELFWQKTLDTEYNQKYSVLYRAECCTIRDEVIENLQIMEQFIPGTVTVTDVSKYLVIEFYKAFRMLDLTRVNVTDFLALCTEFITLYEEDIRDAE